MTTKEFNRKYGLNLSDNSSDLFKRVPNKSKNFVNVAGKPKKMVAEIFKRYFTNWAIVLFTVIFLFVLITSIVVTVSAKHSPNEPISDTMFFRVPKTWTLDAKTNTYVPSNYEWVKGSGEIRNLPPAYKQWIPLRAFMEQSNYAKYMQAFNSNYGGYIAKEIIKPITDNDSAIKIVKTEIIQSDGKPAVKTEILINAFRFYEAMNLNIFLSEGNFPKNASLPQTQAAVNTLLSVNGGSLYPTTILGTNQAGIDIWTSSWIGTWNAIRLALIVATLQTIIGVAVGSYLGFHVGSWIDTVIMRLIEIFVAPPGLIWLLLFASTFGTSDLTLILALVFTGWTGAVGGTRMFIITVKDSEFITASKSVGASKARLIYKHALPAIIGKIANSYVSRIPGIILSVSSLAFLGFFKGDNTNLGALLSSAAGEASQNFWILLLPSLILLSISVSLHFMALGIHDALDPKVIRGK
ncbi:ABC transporter permease [Mycoplasma hafezii]|uniref:ABC transporter permease n=1 Tax=Mycoplasma hafezii TaxID=525886 RepID=UPI003CEED8DF